MKRYIFACLVLAGCQASPSVLSRLEKPGIPEYQKQLDLDECRVAALKEVPPTNAVRSIPGYSSPGTTYCNSMGGMTTCNNVGGVNMPTTVQSYDPNLGLRIRRRDVCLMKRGYTIKPR